MRCMLVVVARTTWCSSGDSSRRVAMSTYRSATVHVAIDAPTATVVAFMSDMEQWKAWAPWGRSAVRTAPNAWELATDDATMKFRFAEPNAFGVLDHDVTLASGVTLTNSLRVTPNASGSDLVMVLLQWPHLSAEEFDRDVQAVTDDFARIKAAIERPR